MLSQPPPMAHDSNLPCDADGVCMICKVASPDEEKLHCSTCATPWHVPCLSSPPQSLSSILQWTCPDCADVSLGAPPPPASVSNDLIAAVRAIEADASISDAEKARRRQELLMSRVAPSLPADQEETDGGDAMKGGEDGVTAGGGVLDVLDGSFNCSFCMQLPDRPVTVNVQPCAGV